MLVSQSRSLLPLFSLKLLQQSKPDAQTNFSFLCLASAGRRNALQLAPLYIILGGYVAVKSLFISAFKPFDSL